MKCAKLKSFLPDLVFDPASVPAPVQQHLRACEACRKELDALQTDFQSTMHLLDEWQTPEPGPYFDTRMSALLNEARQTAPAGFFERVRTRFAFGTHLQFRAAMSAALALVMIAGAGSYAGFVEMHHAPAQQATSAAVHDLQILDANNQTIQQLDAFDNDSDDSGSVDSPILAN